MTQNLRLIHSKQTEFQGITYRSRTEARWAAFFSTLNLDFRYEPTLMSLSNGERYLPDFFIKEFEAWFEVKPENEDIVLAEASKARQFCSDNPNVRLWLAMGPPNREDENIILLNEWGAETSLEKILDAAENRYRILEDRRDEEIYWLASSYVTGDWSKCQVIGGPGTISQHERLPGLHPRVLEAYSFADGVKFD